MPSKAVPPRAVVIPFGVPKGAEGLGLGLAALVHALVRVDGGSVALAQLFARAPLDGDGVRADEGPASRPGGNGAPVEAFLSPQAWRALESEGASPAGLGAVQVVLTGTLEPPSEGAGNLLLLAFDTRDGSTRALVETSLDFDRAGSTAVRALEQLCSALGESAPDGDAKPAPLPSPFGALGAEGGLSWEAFESLLRAERCALRDPTHGGPFNRLAALMHLGRAVQEAPTCAFAVGRLAAVALDVAVPPQGGHPKERNQAFRRLATAALRALERASDDAPGEPSLLEAAAIVHLRLGQPIEAEAAAQRAVLQASGPADERPQPYVLIAEARRMRGDHEGAAEAIAKGRARAEVQAQPAALLTLLTEEASVLAAAGDPAGAEARLRQVLAEDPCHAKAFARLAALVHARGDATSAQGLVDLALAHPEAPAEQLRLAVELCLGAEPEGVARASRVATLARALLDHAPSDPGAALVLARALVQVGDAAAAAQLFAKVEELALGSPFAAAAHRGRFALDAPVASLEIDSLLRAARSEGADLDDALLRARRLSAAHPGWPSLYALGVVERRRGHEAQARDALLQAADFASGAVEVHAELAHAFSALGDAGASLHHAERALLLEGESPRALGALASAELAAGAVADAEATLSRALLLSPEDPELLALRARGRRGPGRTGGEASSGAVRRAYDALGRWVRRAP